MPVFGNIRLKRGSVVAKPTCILSSIPRILSFFAFNFCQSRKYIFTEPWICKWQDYFDGCDTDHWIGFVSKWPKLVQAVLDKQCLKKRIVSYINEMLGCPQKFLQGGQYRHFAYRFADKWTFIESFTLSIPQKIPHESTCSICILSEIIFR